MWRSAKRLAGHVIEAFTHRPCKNDDGTADRGPARGAIWSAFRHTACCLVERATPRRAGLASLMSVAAMTLCTPQQPAQAATVIVTITGTVMSGSVGTNSTQNVFGFPPGTNLAGKSYTLVYTIDDTIGCKYDPGSGYSFIKSSTPSCPGTNPGSPVTSVVLSIGGGSVSFGNQPYSVINGSGAERAAGDVAQFSFAENYNVGNYSGGGDVYANIYFLNPLYAGNYNWESPLVYYPAPSDGATRGSFSYGLGLIDPPIPGWVFLQTASGTLGISSLTVNGPSGAPSSAKNFGGNCACPTPGPGDSSFETAAPSGAGEPINSGTGNMFQAERDFTADPHTGITLTRHYNSQDTTSSSFGTAWHSNWHHGLSVNGNVVTVIQSDGREDTFTNNGAGVYTADPDVTARLSAIANGWQLLKADDSVETYNLSGLLTAITTRAGLVTNLAYDASGHLVQVTGPFGHMLTFAYDANGRVVRMSVPDGGTYTYSYSAANNLASVTYPSGAQRQYLYENANFPSAMTGIIDENGQRFATWAYDAQGRAISSQHAGGADLTTLTYNTGSTSVTDARGNVHGYVFTTQSSIVKPTALTGVPVQTSGGNAFTYDGNGFIAGATDWNGNVTTFTHDPRGDEISRVMASGTSIARTITTAWLPTFHLPSQITDGNRTYSFAYDAKGNLLTRTLTSPGLTSRWSYTYNTAGQVLTATDPRGNVTSYAYDARGDITTMTNALGQVTRYTNYDAGNGRKTRPTLCVLILCLYAYVGSNPMWAIETHIFTGGGGYYFGWPGYGQTGFNVDSGFGWDSCGEASEREVASASATLSVAKLKNSACKVQ